jgi:POT family proton-dependent oligopeptide transporter
VTLELTDAAAPVPGRAERTILGHPVGLAVLAFTEMWERFSYYGMQALLILYMTQRLLTPAAAGHVLGLAALSRSLGHVYGPLSLQALSSQIYGLYTGLVYLTPIFGGLLADRALGQRRSVVIGGLLMAAGQFLLMSERLFFPALILLMLGNGCFKPNIVTQVGRLYAPLDARRDRAYSLFYVGINLGALIAPIACGTVAQVYGWSYGFGLAGIGMLLGLGIFTVGAPFLPAEVSPAQRRVAEPSGAMAADDWRRIGVVALIAVFMVFFWTTVTQLGNIFSLWLRDGTDRTAWGHTIPVAWFQSLNALGMIFITPLLVRLWSAQAGRGAEPSTMTKIALGTALIGLSYVLLAGATAAGGAGLVSALVSIPFVLILTWGELYVSPTSISLFSRIAPARLASMMMGIYFLSTFAGSYLSGVLGGYWGRMAHPAYWLMIGGLSFATSAAVFLARRPVDGFLAARGVRG